MWRLTADGQADPDFGDDEGRVTLDLTWWDRVQGLEDDPFGGGFVLTNLGSTWLFDEHGDVVSEMDFGSSDGGSLILPFALIVSEERLFLIGSDPSWQEPRVAAHVRDGSRDESFGDLGLRSCKGQRCGSGWGGGALDDGGRLVLTDVDKNSVWRLDSNGGFDECFGERGQVEVDGVANLRGVTTESSGEIWCAVEGGSLFRALPAQ